MVAKFLHAYVVFFFSFFTEGRYFFVFFFLHGGTRGLVAHNIMYILFPVADVYTSFVTLSVNPL